MTQIIPDISPARLQVPRLQRKLDTYRAALELVAVIDEDLTRGAKHYRTKGGQLLGTLDEVVRAILDSTLAGDLC